MCPRPAPAPDEPLSRKRYEKELRKLHAELVALQLWVQEKGLKVCIIFEGRDGAGKGGTIKAITSRVSPRVFRVVALPSPSDREKSQMYMQRYLTHLPAAGEVVIFDRSWYNRAGVERVMGFCSDDEAKRFLAAIPLVERAIVQSGIILLKYWLEVSPDEQTRRLEDRINDPRKLWKLSPMDLKSYSRWYDYSRARDDMFAATDSGYAPLVRVRLQRQAPRAPRHHQPPAQAGPVQGAQARQAQVAQAAEGRRLSRPALRRQTGAVAVLIHQRLPRRRMVPAPTGSTRVGSRGRRLARSEPPARCRVHCTVRACHTASTRSHRSDSVMNSPAKPASSGSLSNVFAASAMRADNWRELNAQARAWSTAAAGSPQAEKLRAESARIFAGLSRLEPSWAFPGARLIGTIAAALEAKDAASFARLVRRVSGALLSGSYRHDDSAWDPTSENEGVLLESAPPATPGIASHRPYFEVLVVTPSDPSTWAARATTCAACAAPTTPSSTKLVHVGSFEDAALAVIVNDNLQAVVMADGFGFGIRHDLPDLHEFLAAPREGRPEQHRARARWPPRWRKAIKNFRPELDLYLLSDRTPETLAGSDEAAPIRRMFHHVEEPMEIHLSILDGINDRYETPYFDNLKKYAQRPIGTFHALPIARGKSVFRSNWIRDMGQFYGTNIFFAESSATTGGLDSLLEPTGNIKKAQDMVARAFGAKRAFLGTNGTSTSNKIVVQAVCKPGDIVIVDRNCHKSHHYGFVLAGAQPYYVEAFPLTQYSMYGAVPLRTIKKALLDCMAEGKLDRVKVIDMTNCTFDGHMYNPRARDGGMPRDQARPGLPVGRGLVRLRALQPVPPPPHRRWARPPR